MISISDFYGKEAGGGGPSLQPALNPTFGTPTSLSGGFRVQVTNYDAAFTWTTSVTAGSASISGSGLVTVTGLADSASATVTVNTSRTGYYSGSGSVQGTASDGGTIDPPPPVDTPIESVISGGSFTTSNGKKIGTITNTGAEGQHDHKQGCHWGP